MALSACRPAKPRTPERFLRLPESATMGEVRSPCCNKLLYFGQVLSIIQRRCDGCGKIVQVEPVHDQHGTRVPAVNRVRV
jgi:hypothetical protein